MTGVQTCALPIYIRSFIGVVNYKSFSLAAKYLFLSQPTISAHIKRLEEELGVQLLVRSTKDVILSEEGLTFYPYAVQLLETEKEALSRLNKEEKSEGGFVSIATSSVPGNYIFPGFLAYFQKQCEGIFFRILEGDSEDVMQKVLHFEAEIGIGGVRSTNEKLHCETLFEDEIVLITPNKEKYRSMNGSFPIAVLKKEIFITRETGSGTKTITDNIERELKLNVHALHVAAQFGTSEMVRRAVEAGTGVAFISKIAARESLDNKKVLEFRFPEVQAKRHIYLVYHKERVLSPASKNVIRRLREYCAEG